MALTAEVIHTIGYVLLGFAAVGFIILCATFKKVWLSDSHESKPVVATNKPKLRRLWGGRS